ncbi:class I SAM-dependent methyltransferase [Polaromonas aquatica]|uniref:class I SAM-dependent methyltransferase n=1 Tax=Polaromonas aquatica TaxID=332657 RepID=UPI003D6555DD
MATQEDINTQNSEFWNTLCGTSLAQGIGIKDGSRESLEIFDKWYMDLYPYLLDRVPVNTMKDKAVLEIGLGYGTLSQKIAEAGARYHGLDIASGPVAMVNSRMGMLGVDGLAQQGNMLECPFEDGTFDAVVSIGCFHHTGDTQRCLDETFRVLKPGGHAYLMVYNQFSFRQWVRFPKETWEKLRRERAGYAGYVRVEGTEAQRKAYDADMSGKAAPETDFFSIKQLQHMMRRYKSVHCRKENFDPLWRIPRKNLLGNFGRIAGLDIYIHAEK